MNVHAFRWNQNSGPSREAGWGSSLAWRGNALRPLLLTWTSLVILNAAQASPNHLSGQMARYLNRAISQPVDWYPWGANAFKRAKELNRPILLDMGAIWCAWCDLMDRESYKRRDLAAFINANS
jgi:hypothetical protein